MISFVVAMDSKGLIGRDNALPWRLPADLKHFKALTLGKPVIMGRKTYESIGKPLVDRLNIVVTRNPDYQAPGCVVAHSAQAALDAAGSAQEIMVIGGAQLYRELLPQAERLYITRIAATFEGDAWFPALEAGAWRERERRDCEADDKNPYAYSFVVLERINPASVAG